MIPVAAVARPRQGIQVPATGAPPLSAGSIIAAAGDGKVVITEDVAPQGGTGTYTRQVYRSTTQGTPGSPVQGATALPHTDFGVSNATTYYYTLQVSDGSAAADSPQVGPVTPVSAGTGGVLIYAHDFNDGTRGDLGFFADLRANPGSYQIIPDPTGAGRGMVAELTYQYTNPADSPAVDVDVVFPYVPALPNGARQDKRPTWGEGFYWRTDFYLYRGTVRRAGISGEQRKLVYGKYGDGDTFDGIIMTLWSRSDDTGMDLMTTHGPRGTPHYDSGYRAASITWETWHRAELAFKMNTINPDGTYNFDGWIKFWLYPVGSPRLIAYEATNVALARAHGTTPLENCLFEFDTGAQHQMASEPGDCPSFMTKRLVDDFQIWTQEP